MNSRLRVRFRSPFSGPAFTLRALSSGRLGSRPGILGCPPPVIP
jgi:hypothetical protein